MAKTLSLSPSTKKIVCNKATALSRKITRRLSAIQKRLDQENKTRQDELDLRIEEERKEREWQTARLERRIPQALQGVQRIFEFSDLDEIGKLLRSLGSPGYSGRFYLYSATRPSGDAFETKGAIGDATRNVEIYLTGSTLTVSAGSTSNGNGEEYSFHFLDSKETMWRELEKFASPTYLNIFSATNPENRFKVEWDPDDLAFQVLVSCSKRNNFERIVLEAMRQLESS